MYTDKFDQEINEALKRLKDACINKSKYEYSTVTSDRNSISDKDEIYKFDLDF